MWPFGGKRRKLELNPNRFPSSIEALARRIAKKAELPSINKTVDLVNILSLKYLLPMGAHDREILPGDIELRLARRGQVYSLWRGRARTGG